MSRHELETVRSVKNHVEALLNRVQRIRKARQALAHKEALLLAFILCIVWPMSRLCEATGAGGAAG